MIGAASAFVAGRGCSVVVRGGEGGGGADGSGGVPTNASIAGGVGKIPLLVARSGTMIAAMITAVCAAIDSGTEYRRLPPIEIDGATNMF